MKTKKNLFFNFIKTLMGILFPFISFPYAARILNASNFGMVQYCISIIAYFALFAELGIHIYAVREGVKYREDKGQLSVFVKEILFINIVTSLIAYLVLFILLIFWDDNTYRSLLLVCSLSIFFNTFQINWLYQIVEDFRYISIRNVILQVIALFLLFIFVRDENDYLQYAFITVFSAGGSFVLNLYNSKKYIDWKKKVHLINSRYHLKAILIIFGITAAAQIYLNLDTVMLGSMCGNETVAYYSAAVKLINAMKVLFASINVVFLPHLASFIIKEKTEQFSQLVYKALDMVLLLLVPCCFGIIALNREILSFFYGKEYLQSGFVLMLLAMNMFFAVVDGILYQQVCLPLGLEKRACIATISGAVINFGLNLFFISKYGMNGAAVTTIISECAVFILLEWFIKEKIKFYKCYSNFYQYFLGSLVMLIIIKVLKYFMVCSIFLTLLICVLVGVLIYGVMLYLMKNRHIEILKIKILVLVRKTNKKS